MKAVESDKIEHIVQTIILKVIAADACNHTRKMMSIQLHTEDGSLVVKSGGSL